MSRICGLIAWLAIAGPWSTAACSRAPDAAAPAHGEMLSQAVCRPVFQKDGRPSGAGTAFFLQDPLYPGAPLLVTAHHLFGLAGGPGGGMRWSQVPKRVTEATCTGLDGRHAWRTGPGAAIVGAHALWGVQDLKDIAIFHLAPDQPTPPSLVLSRAAPQPGDPVWLVAETASPLDRGKHLHRAEVVGSSEYLAFVYDNRLIPLANTSGAPIVNAQGEVVGVNVGGGRGSGDHTRFGVADDVGTIRSALIDARLP